MPLYEHVFLARQDASSQQVEELTNQIAGVITGLGVIRYLTVRVEEHEEGPSAMMRKADRDRDRDDRGGGFRGDRGPRRPREEASAVVEE
jgi:small subunit ribosomal protein S6